MAGETSFYQIDAQDTGGAAQRLFAAYRNQQVALFRIADHGDHSGKAEVMYLLPAASAADIAAVIGRQLIDVRATRLLSPEHHPALRGARLLLSHPWTEMDRAVVGVILGLPSSEVE